MCINYLLEYTASMVMQRFIIQVLHGSITILILGEMVFSASLSITGLCPSRKSAKNHRFSAKANSFSAETTILKICSRFLQIFSNKLFSTFFQQKTADFQQKIADFQQKTFICFAKRKECWRESTSLVVWFPFSFRNAFILLFCI